MVVPRLQEGRDILVKLEKKLIVDHHLLIVEIHLQTVVHLLVLALLVHQVLVNVVPPQEQVHVVLKHLGPVIALPALPALDQILDLNLFGEMI